MMSPIEAELVKTSRRCWCCIDSGDCCADKAVGALEADGDVD